jgi:hypothetical protein
MNGPDTDRLASKTRGAVIFDLGAYRAKAQGAPSTAAKPYMSRIAVAMIALVMLFLFALVLR